MADQSIAERLSEPFDPREVKWLPKSVKGNRCMAIAYVSARAIMERLDSVFGYDGWQDEYDLLPDGSVRCRLMVKAQDGGWVVKSDVGSPSEQPDAGDRSKAAVSDSLKRTAVKLGIGRYLYSLPNAWVDYDPAKRMITNPPQLPSWALPKGPQRQQQPQPVKQSQQEQPKASTLPKDGREFRQRLVTYDKALATAGDIESVGQFVKKIEEFAQTQRFDPEMNNWGEREIKAATRFISESAAKQDKPAKQAS